METAREAFDGNVDADLGGYLFKKRVARDGGGKSGGYRTILCFRKMRDERIFFVYGFPKNAKGNISPGEAKALKAVARSLVDLSDRQIGELKGLGAIREVGGGGGEAED